MDGKPHELTEFYVLNDNYVKVIAAMEECNGVNGLLTFKDEDFYQHWGVGENNCGRERHLKQKGIIKIDDEGKLSVSEEKPGIEDVVGRYLVTIGNKRFDTIRSIYLADAGQVTDFYFDKEGREILKRYFVPNEWKNYLDKYENCEYIYLNNNIKVCTVYVVPDFVL